ncbi:lactose-binding lectin l-2-like [Cyprinodon tularosa]|uniref:lactose-binding lectin l-2-like n=1 Tax=Cyprinodon tularosa TaxID=77115 RepID=UPI0018E1E399|nr:lactose-binding lectin l-2-like [Cyprinodon tularosa]
MILFLLLFALALGSVSTSSEQEIRLERGTCPMFWYSFNGRCYKYVATLMTWSKAELHCVSEGANLVSVHSFAEHDFVKSLIKNFDTAEGRTWIGLSDIHKEGGYMWSDGSAAKFFSWGPGEPNNNGGAEHCVHTNFDQDKKWNDAHCSDYYPSVCASRTAFI